jgi:hypothetical protein
MGSSADFFENCLKVSHRLVSWVFDRPSTYSQNPGDTAEGCTRLYLCQILSELVIYGLQEVQELFNYFAVGALVK